eukprot:SAG31_NODE_7681_length_1618_cov_1.584595_3_plen_32_part_01
MRFCEVLKINMRSLSFINHMVIFSTNIFLVLH